MMHRTLVRRAGTVAAAVAALALGLTACSGGTDAGSGGDSGSDLTPVRVGNLVFVGTAPFQLGVDQGFFEDEGLDIQITEGDNPAALAGQVTSGQLDVAFTTVVFQATAVTEGADLKLIGSVDGVIDPENAASAIITTADSGVTSLSDLAGKKVAIPALGSELHLATLADIDAAGVDTSTVEFVQTPFPDMEQALESGNVDAAASTEPFMSSSISGGAVVLSEPEVNILPNASVTAWTASEAWLSENEDTAEAFVRGMQRSIEYAKENQDALLEMMPDYSGLTAEQVESMSFGTILEPELNLESIERQVDLMQQFGFIDEAPTVETLVHEFGS